MVAFHHQELIAVSPKKVRPQATELLQCEQGLQETPFAKRQRQLKAVASTNLPAAARMLRSVSSTSPTPSPNALPSRQAILPQQFPRHKSATMELPAYTFCHPPEQPRRKSQTLTFTEEGFPVVRPLGQSKVLPVNDTQDNYDNSGACYACVKQSTGPTPAWLKFDRQVLRFYAFFKEQVDERVEENARYRKCTIYFYLADGMIHIGEPAQRNSGIYFQGVFLKKQKVPNGRGGFLEPADFQLGRDITIYSHTFHIVGCDVFTKRYLMKQRLPVGDEEPWPNEPLEEYRAHYRAVIKPHHKEYALRQFLDLDGKVLRFFCVWDDRAVPYGERRPYVLHYFLGDDTIEVLELNERNSGRMHFPMLIRRKKLEKETPHDLLSQKKICGEKDFGPKNIYYRDTDLHIGSYIRVFDRDLLLHDVDEFTRNYYRTKYGYSEDMLAPIDVQEDGPEFARMEIPEHNGIGSEADSLMNCIMLIPQAPQKDFIKFIYKDGKILTFTCRMVEDNTHKLHPVDKTRMMIFQYYLADDTIQVFEPPARNSGCVSGKYIQRVPAPRVPGTQRPYDASDCFMDQRMYLFDRIFELMEADEWTLKHMEESPKLFPLANYEWVANKIKAAIKKLPADKSAEFSKSIKGPDPPPSPPPRNPCSPMPPASPCGNKCAEMATPPLSPKRPCSPPDPPIQSPPSWPKSPPKSPANSMGYKSMSIKEILCKYGINVTKQEVVTLERYVSRNKDKFANVYSLLKSYF